VSTRRPPERPGGCARWHEDLSADLDGELAPNRRPMLAAHLASCRDCAALAEELRALHRAVRLRPAEAVPDLSGRILAVANPPRAGRGDWIRTSLLVVALTQLAFALPGLAGRLEGAAVHVGRHLGSLELAVALGLAYAAWRPVRAFGLLPMAGALALAITVTAVVDVTSGRAPLLGEAHHVLDLAGVVLLWLLAGAPRPWRRRGRAGVPGHRVVLARGAADPDALSDAS
jgi:predicted anti-sigma-YlaC factor YlaD